MRMPPRTPEQERRDADLRTKFERSRAAVEAMSPIDRAIMMVEQRMSFVRGEIGIDRPGVTEADVEKRFSEDAAVVLMREVKRLHAYVVTLRDALGRFKPHPMAMRNLAASNVHDSGHATSVTYTYGDYRARERALAATKPEDA